MAIPTNARKGVTVDLFKESYGTQTFITRRGEKGETLSIQLTQNGQRINPLTTPLAVKLKGVNSDNKYVEVKSFSANASSVDIELTQDWNASAGAFKKAYIEVSTNSGTDLITSVDLNWLVLDNATITDNDTAHYVDELEELIKQLQEKADQTLQEIVDKLASSNLAIDDLNARITKANADLNDLITSITNDLNNKMDVLNADIDSALEEFRNGDFYTKAESDNLFLTQDKLKEASTSQKGIVMLSNEIGSQDTTKAATPYAVNVLNGSIASVRNSSLQKASSAPATVSTAVDFTTPPTINGQPIGTGDNDIRDLYSMYAKTISGDGVTNNNNANALTLKIYDSSVMQLVNSDDTVGTISADGTKITFNRDMTLQLNVTAYARDFTKGTWADISVRQYSADGTLLGTTGGLRHRTANVSNVTWVPLYVDTVCQISAGDSISILKNGDLQEGIIYVQNFNFVEIPNKVILKVNAKTKELLRVVAQTTVDPGALTGNTNARSSLKLYDSTKLAVSYTDETAVTISSDGTRITFNKPAVVNCKFIGHLRDVTAGTRMAVHLRLFNSTGTQIDDFMGQRYKFKSTSTALDWTPLEVEGLLTVNEGDYIDVLKDGDLVGSSYMESWFITELPTETFA